MTYLALLLLTMAAIEDDESDAPPTIAEATEGLERIEGVIPLYWDDETGRLLGEIGRFGEELLYQVALPAGLGSNPVGLDRGQLAGSRVVVFKKIGPKVLLIEPNPRYRAVTESVPERRAVADSFATSVHWGFAAEASEGGRVLVDLTPFLLRDAHGVARSLDSADQGDYRLDIDRSAVDIEHTKGFPKNTELESILTFATDDDPGRYVRETAPDPRSITVRQRQSFIELPMLEGDGAYRPRSFDPRVGAFAIEFYDFARPITEPVEVRRIVRHRLVKADPMAARSRAVEPIVYHVDPGAPEPIRSALIEGASWWNEAFEAAGFEDAFRVEVLPDDADPLDVRYNVIQWVHRSTRGWSYGSTVVDPRTGEILKGHVTLGSLRVRQDYLLGNGLTPVVASGAGAACGMVPPQDDLAGLDPRVDAEAMALARLRQLSAHEVGHTLGLSHNFAASTYGRASVMDYPAPNVTIDDDGAIDLSDAYGVGIGPYDKFAITYAYAQFPPDAGEEVELARIVREGVEDGMLFLTDADARPPGAAHPLANLWDNGDDPVAMLRHELEVRRIALERFGLENLDMGMPLSKLQATLLPLYLHHRYQVEAAVKSVGGASYTYALKEDGGPMPELVVEIVPAARQREALEAVLATIDPGVLVLPDRILGLIPPSAFGFEGGTSEDFSGRTGPTFDPIAAATIAADLAVSGLLQRERAARLVDYHARNPENPGLGEIVAALIDRCWWESKPADRREEAVAHAVQSLVVDRLMDLAADDDAMPEVRAEAAAGLRSFLERIDVAGSDTHELAIIEEIDRFLNRPAPTRSRTDPPAAPPGSPIGVY